MRVGRFANADCNIADCNIYEQFVVVLSRAEANWPGVYTTKIALGNGPLVGWIFLRTWLFTMALSNT
ncbi:MAG: hypothetical protein WCA27_34195 [Candidatus Sulfotelmatobacter sp.]